VKTKHLWLLAGALAMGCGSDEPSVYDKLGNEASRGDGGSSTRGDAGTKPGDGDDVCGKHRVKGDRAIPDILIVLDRSTSMTPGGNDRRTDRWRGSANAVTQLTNKYGSGINFGLMTFPGREGGLGGILGGAQCTPGQVDVEIGPDKGQEIQQVISRTDANGYTPTAATLEAAAEVIGIVDVTDQALATPKYVLLVTDGDPNCSPGFQPGRGNNEDPVAREQTIAAIEKLTAQGVKTFVVGFQTAGTNFEGQLDRMAAAGNTGEDTHRSVESAEDLAATFDELAANATTCSYQLSEEVDARFVLVRVGGTQRNYNQPDGWKLGSDKRTVTLQGKACEDAKAGKVFEVEVSCDPIIAI
jgi:hypothetical protein